MQVALIIEGVFFYSLSLPSMVAHLLWSLPPMLSYLPFCRGPGATFFASGKKKPNSKLVLSVACPERIEFTLSVIEGNVVVGDPD